MARISRALLPPLLPLFLLAHPASALTSYSTTPEEDSCILTGDADIYGPGVRASFFLSFVAGVLAMEWNLLDELEKVRRGVVVIAMAVTVNTIVSTTRGSFAVLEWYIVFLMTVVLSLPIFVFPWRHHDTSIIKGVYALTIALVLAVQPWVYFILAHQGSREECTAFVFLFARINAQSAAWLTFCKVFSIIGYILTFFLIWRFAWSAIVDSGILKKLLNRRKHASLLEHPEPDTRSTQANKVIDLVKLAAFALVGIGSIVFVEEVLRINRIDLSEAPLDRSSQLIPLLVALFNILPILWGLVKARFVEK